MAEIEQTAEFSASPDRVWAVLTDLDRIGEWVEEHRGFPDGAPADLREGVSYKQTLAAAGRDVDLEWTVVGHDAPRSLAFDGAGPAGSSATLRYELSEAGGGTRMIYRTSFELPGGPLGSMVGKVAAPDEDDARATLDRLRTLVEAA